MAWLEESPITESTEVIEELVWHKPSKELPKLAQKPCFLAATGVTQTGPFGTVR